MRELFVIRLKSLTVRYETDTFALTYILPSYLIDPTISLLSDFERITHPFDRSLLTEA